MADKLHKVNRGKRRDDGPNGCSGMDLHSCNCQASMDDRTKSSQLNSAEITHH